MTWPANAEHICTLITAYYMLQGNKQIHFLGDLVEIGSEAFA